MEPSPVGSWDVKHREWIDALEIEEGGRFHRLMGDAGTWEVVRGVLLLRWDNWGEERAIMVDGRIAGERFSGVRIDEEDRPGLYAEEENTRLVKEARERASASPPAEVGVIFAYYKEDDATLRNFSSFKESNPGADVIALDVGGENEFLGRLNGHEVGSFWINADAPYYEYYRRRGENCKRWVIAEWDMFCNVDLEEFFGPLWDEPFVSTDVHLPGDKWVWFKDVKKLPGRARPMAVGCAPMAGTLISDECMERIVLESWWVEKPIFCELRIATLARMAGYEPVPNPGASRCLRWRPRPEIDGPGLWHPIKY